MSRVLRMSPKGTMPPQYPGDCERIQKALASVGVIVSIRDAEKLWEDYSDTYCAGWLFLPEADQEIIDNLTEEA